MVIVIASGNARKFSGVLSKVPSFLFYRFKHMQRFIFVFLCVYAHAYFVSRTCVFQYILGFL